MTMSRRRVGRRGGGFRSRGPRRASEWFERDVDLTIASGGQQSVTISANVTDAQKKGMTIVRLLIQLSAVLIAAGTGGQLFMGLVMVTTDAIAAAVLPDVDVATEKVGWLWRAQRIVSTTAPNDSSQFGIFEVDIRSRRKFAGEDMDLELVVNLPASSGNMNVDGWIRMLCLKA